MPNITGVRVYLADTLGVVLHERGLTFSHYDDGCLAILDEKIRIALYAPREWAWVELVHAEVEAQNVTINVDSSAAHAAVQALRDKLRGVEAAVEQTPAERIWAAQAAIQDAQEASARSCAEHAAAIADAHLALADLKRELGELA